MTRDSRRSMMRWLGLLTCGLVPSSSGCVESTTVVLDGDDGGSSSGGRDPSTTTSTSVGTTLPDPTSPGTTTLEPADGTAGSDDVLFLAQTDLGTGNYQCDLYAQNCPPGQKCMPVGTDGGSNWIGRQCRPMVDDPVGIDETCHVEGSTFAGLDDCGMGAMCWDVHPATNEGHCVPFCVGSDLQATCEDPHRACAPSSEEAMSNVLCLPICHPLASNCEPGYACYPIIDWWSCAPDGSGDMGAHGDPCEFLNWCDPGLVCLGSSALPPGLPCEGAAGCCVEVCDLFDELGDAQCTGAPEGVACVPWFEPGQAPPSYEDVGVCVLP